MVEEEGERRLSSTHLSISSSDKVVELIKFDDSPSFFSPPTPTNPFPPMDPFRLLTQGASFSKKSALFKQKKVAAQDSDDEDESNEASTSGGPAPLPAALDFFNVGSGVKEGEQSGENAKGKRKREERPVEAGE